MNRLLILALFFFGFCTPSFCKTHQYHYINSKLTWHQARDYCRANYQDLATITSADDISEKHPEGKAWIGLDDDREAWKGPMEGERNSWRWSATDEPGRTTFTRWRATRPDILTDKYLECIVMEKNGFWEDARCSAARPFCCYEARGPDGQKTFIYIEDKLLNWTGARDFCREHYNDLAIIENLQENQELKAKIKLTLSWVGLYRLTWRWSDGSNSSFRNWKSIQLSDDKHSCAARGNDNLWSEEDCSLELPFWCQSPMPKTKKIFLKVNIKTNADLTDSATNTRLLEQLRDQIASETGITDLNLTWKIQLKKPKEEDGAGGRSTTL